jgi:hypothetical protein
VREGMGRVEGGGTRGRVGCICWVIYCASGRMRGKEVKIFLGDTWGGDSLCSGDLKLQSREGLNRTMVRR